MLPCEIGLLKGLWSLTIVTLVSCAAKRSPLWVARSYAWKWWDAPLALPNPTLLLPDVLGDVCESPQTLPQSDRPAGEKRG
jgi:hypothetical protein